MVSTYQHITINQTQTPFPDGRRGNILLAKHWHRTGFEPYDLCVRPRWFRPLPNLRLADPPNKYKTNHTIQPDTLGIERSSDYVLINSIAAPVLVHSLGLA